MVNISHISFSYGEKNIIDNLSYSFQRDGFYVILGRSGEGKTTFLSLLQGVLTPNKGRIEMEDEVITQVFQSPLLIDYLNVKENILLPLTLQGKKEKEEEESVKEALSRVNLSGFEERMPKTLSGGESMRVSIARALVQKSTVLLLDEPTGQLDETNSKEIYTLLKELSKEMILIVVTHDEKTITPYGDVILELKNGKLFQKKVNKISRLHQKKPKEENKGCLSFSTALSLQNKFLKRRKTRYFLSALFLAIDLLFFYFSFALKTDAKPFLENILETRYGYHTVKIQKREEVATSGHLTLKKEKIPTSSELALVGISNSYYSLEYFLPSLLEISFVGKENSVSFLPVISQEQSKLKRGRKAVTSSEVVVNANFLASFSLQEEDALGKVISFHHSVLFSPSDVKEMELLSLSYSFQIVGISMESSFLNSSCMYYPYHEVLESLCETALPRISKAEGIKMSLGDFFHPSYESEDFLSHSLLLFEKEPVSLKERCDQVKGMILTSSDLEVLSTSSEMLDSLLKVVDLFLALNLFCAFLFEYLSISSLYDENMRFFALLSLYQDKKKGKRMLVLALSFSFFFLTLILLLFFIFTLMILCNFLLKMNSFPVFFHGIKIKPLFLLSFLSMVICVMSSSLPLRRIKQENIKKELEGED